MTLDDDHMIRKPELWDGLRNAQLDLASFN
jgi:hypothetical protein